MLFYTFTRSIIIYIYIYIYAQSLELLHGRILSQKVVEQKGIRTYLLNIVGVSIFREAKKAIRGV